MKVSDDGLYFIASHEGVVPAPYYDSVGVLTFGIGHTKSAGAPDPATMPKGMPENVDAAVAVAFDVFAQDIERYAADVRRAVTAPMTQHEFDAAVSFHFNTGAIGRATWVKHWNAGDKAEASRQIMNWRKPPEIIPRRTAERDLWASGDYGRGGVQVWRVDGNSRLRGAFKSIDRDETLRLIRNGAPERPAAPRNPGPTPQAPTKGLAALVGALLAALGAKLAGLW